MPKDTYDNTPSTKVQMVYDVDKQKWVKFLSSSSEPSEVQMKKDMMKQKNDASKASTAPTTKTQVDSKSKASKEMAESVYNTLLGDLNVRLSKRATHIKVNDTVNITGVGNHLSGKYYVSQVRRELTVDSGMTLTITVVKTGFGDSLKSPILTTQTQVTRPPVMPKEVASFKVGDKVKIIDANAVYSNASDGVKVPSWVKSKVLTISQISSDGSRVLLKEIVSWTYTKFIQIAE